MIENQGSAVQMNDLQDFFKFKSRKRGNTLEYARSLLIFLNKQKYENNEWVRSHVILKELKQKYPKLSDSSYYHLLEILETNHFIEKRLEKGIDGPGKKQTSYRLDIPVFRDIDLMKHEEHIQRHIEDFSTILKFAIKYDVYRSELKRCCEMQGLDFSQKECELGDKSLDIWNKGYKVAFGEWK